MGRLDGKVAVITGGAGGFGRGACELWAKEGAKILTCDVKVAEGEAVAKEIRSNGGEIVFIPADVSKTEDAKRIVAKTIETYGALDILYNNAGILGPRGVEVADFAEEDARRRDFARTAMSLHPPSPSLPKSRKMQPFGQGPWRSPGSG